MVNTVLKEIRRRVQRNVQELKQTLKKATEGKKNLNEDKKQ